MIDVFLVIVLINSILVMAIIAGKANRQSEEGRNN
jgi:hypothetical protein